MTRIVIKKGAKLKAKKLDLRKKRVRGYVTAVKTKQAIVVRRKAVDLKKINKTICLK